MLRTPNALFEGSKAYSINYGVMRKIKPEVWSKAFNDPMWIRSVSQIDSWCLILVTNLTILTTPFALSPKKCDQYQTTTTCMEGSEYQFEKTFKICYGASSSCATLLRNIIIELKN